MRVPILIATRGRRGAQPIRENEKIWSDPSKGNNRKSTDNTETSIIYDAQGGEYDFTSEGYADNLFWFSGNGPNAPNGNAYWERLETASVPFGIDLTGVSMSGAEAEIWSVLQVENDPETAPLDLSGAPWQFGSGSSITIYPTSDLGAGARNVWADFGSTARHEIVDATLVTAGFDAPSLDAWHIIREQVSGSVGAGNLTYKMWLDGTLVTTVSSLTSGWKATPRFWGAEAGATTRGWAGRLAYFQVLQTNLNTGQANQQLNYLQNRFGL
jgi:hypothetical protein